MSFCLSARLKLVLNWAPAAIGVALIAAESTSTLSANNTSRWLLPIWIRLFGSISAAHWAEVHFLLRKIGHFTGYGLLSVAFLHGWRSTFKQTRDFQSWWWRCTRLAVFSTLAVATADEYHQSFLPNRSGSPVVVGIDLCGAIVSQALFLRAFPLFGS